MHGSEGAPAQQCAGATRPGCDGDRGVSRATIPAHALTRYSHEFGYSWLSILAEVPTDPSGMAIHSRGLAGMIPRGAHHTRIWITEVMHNAGDPAYAGEFRKQVARAELQRQFTSPAANRLFGELIAGVN
jgi:hypothetical protein